MVLYCLVGQDTWCETDSWSQELQGRQVVMSAKRDNYLLSPRPTPASAYTTIENNIIRFISPSKIDIKPQKEFLLGLTRGRGPSEAPGWSNVECWVLNSRARTFIFTKPNLANSWDTFHITASNQALSTIYVYGIMAMSGVEGNIFLLFYCCYHLEQGRIINFDKFVSKKKIHKYWQDYYRALGQRVSTSH